MCRHKLENNNYNNFEEDIHKANDLNGQLAHLKREELQRIQSQSGSIKVSMVYLTMIQEAQNIVTYSINLMKVSRKFQGGRVRTFLYQPKVSDIHFAKRLSKLK